MRKDFLGKARFLSPQKKVVAGSYGTWRITYTAGRYGIDDGGSILLATRSASDRQLPQTEDPQAPGYVSVKTTGEAKLRVFYDGNYYIRPWRAALVIWVYDGTLKEGDRVIITYGDTSGGSPGMRAQTFAEKEHTFKVLVDPFGTGRFCEVEKSPTMSIVGGPANTLQISAPSCVWPDKPFSIYLRALDSWGNPSSFYRETVELEGWPQGVDVLQKCTFTPQDKGAKRVDGVNFPRKGVCYIKAKDTQGKGVVSNPIVCYSMQPELKIYWGDLHGQTRSTVGTGTVEEYFKFAREVGGLDFCSWQGNDFQVKDENWEEVKRQVSLFHTPGKFITFLGYEWSGLTPAGGDHNIYFLHDDEKIYRSSHALIENGDMQTDRYPISRLWQTFEGKKDVMAVPHVGGRYANFDFYHPELIPLIEIYSHHGCFEWFAEEAIKRGLKVGFIAGSDDHTGRPGLTYPLRETSHGEPTFGVKGGYTGVYATELTRSSLWDAFRKRHCYATTGERIVLSFGTDEKKMMGDEYHTQSPPRFSLEVAGTTPLMEVEIKRGLDTICRYPSPSQLTKGKHLLCIQWSGVRAKTRSKHTTWDGGLVVREGKIVSFKEFAFPRYKEGITQVSNQHLKWKSTTYGDPTGVMLDVDTSEDTEITFYSRQKTFSFKPSKISCEPKIVDAGGVNQKVKISLIPPDEAPSKISLHYTDDNIKEGVNPYWVKVVQYDGAMAWSSPIFINHKCKKENDEV